MGQWITQSNSLDELKHALKGVAGRIKQYGWAGPIIYYTDQCCGEEPFLASIFETLQSEEGIDIAGW